MRHWSGERLLPVPLHAPVQTCLGMMNVSLPKGSARLRGPTLPEIEGSTVTFHLIVRGDRNTDRTEAALARYRYRFKFTLWAGASSLSPSVTFPRYALQVDCKSTSRCRIANQAFTV